MEDICCGACKHKRASRGRVGYCGKYGLNLSGTLERLEICKRENGKEVDKKIIAA